MYIVIFAILAFFGLFMFFAPGAIYEMREAWKSHSDSEPSEAYIFWTKVSGILCLAGGIIGIGFSVAYYIG